MNQNSVDEGSLKSAAAAIPGVAARSSPQYKHLKILRALALGLPLLAATRLHAQGCAQCRDNLQATPPAVQQAYRHAIELLAFSGLAVFTGGALLIRRNRS